MIEHKEMFTRLPNQPRVGQQVLLPGGVKNRHMDIIDVVEEATQTSIVLNNGDQVTNQSIVTSLTENRIIVSVERATFVGSVSIANLLPLGSSVDESQWQVIGPFNAIYKVVNGVGIETEEYENANQLYIRNISAGTQTVIFQHRVKYIMNRGGTA